MWNRASSFANPHLSCNYYLSFCTVLLLSLLLTSLHLSDTCQIHLYVRYVSVSHTSMPDTSLCQVHLYVKHIFMSDTCQIQPPLSLLLTSLHCMSDTDSSNLQTNRNMMRTAATGLWGTRQGVHQCRARLADAPNSV